METYSTYWVIFKNELGPQYQNIKSLEKSIKGWSVHEKDYSFTAIYDIPSHKHAIREYIREKILSTRKDSNYNTSGEVLIINRNNKVFCYKFDIEYKFKYERKIKKS